MPPYPHDPFDLLYAGQPTRPLAAAYWQPSAVPPSFPPSFPPPAGGYVPGVRAGASNARRQVHFMSQPVRPAGYGSSTPAPPPPPPVVPPIVIGAPKMPGEEDLYASLRMDSPHEVDYFQIRYATTEHLFHAMKFLPHAPQIAEAVRNSAHPAQEAHRNRRSIRADWERIKFCKMEEALYHKYGQHEQLLVKDLVATGDRPLLDANDPYNALGQLLMKLRGDYQKRAKLNKRR